MRAPGFAHAQPLVAVDQVSQHCFAGFDFVKVSKWAEAEATEQWLPNPSPCLPPLGRGC